ncbi:MAG: metal ABC transporter substrate-binding protein [Verrucomicrobium sp.]|nr:metal ABC transporter substrate-binding protein [Verrucomicrobium sp.]
MRRALLLFLLLFPAWADAAPLRVVASFLPLYAAAQSIGSGRAEVADLGVGGADPHDFSPKPSDLKKIAQADLLVVNGLGLESWLEPTVKEVGAGKLVVVDASAGFDYLPNPHTLVIPEPMILGDFPNGGRIHVEKPETNAPVPASPANVNPHVWLDPLLHARQAQAIAAAMEKADPANAAFYHANLQAYLARVWALDEKFKALFAALPAGEKNLVTFHDAFPYFAARYGLHYLGSVEEFPEKAPSPRQLERLTDLIRKNRVGVLFAEEGYEPKLLQTLAAQTGARVAQLDTLEVGPPAADAYFVRMEANLDALRKAWEKTSP